MLSRRWALAPTLCCAPSPQLAEARREAEALRAAAAAERGEAEAEARAARERGHAAELAGLQKDMDLARRVWPAAGRIQPQGFRV